jgi:hypothetical protein
MKVSSPGIDPPNITGRANKMMFFCGNHKSFQQIYNFFFCVFGFVYTNPAFSASKGDVNNSSFYRVQKPQSFHLCQVDRWAQADAPTGWGAVVFVLGAESCDDFVLAVLSLKRDVEFERLVCLFDVLKFV